MTVVGRPESRGAEGGAQRRLALGDGRPAVAQHRWAVECERRVSVVVLMATVRVRRGNADRVVVHAQGRAVHGRQESGGVLPVRGFTGVHLLQLKQW